MLRYSKLLLRRLAYVPWLLAVGLVLGGAEEAAAQAPLTVYDAVIEEGGLVPFTVALSPADDEMVTVTYTASIEGGNTADAADFTATTGVLTFYVGDQIKTVYVQTTPDIYHENNETFTLTLSAATDASGVAVTLSDATATGTILNDDRPPVLTVADRERRGRQSGDLHGGVVGGDVELRAGEFNLHSFHWRS